MRDRQSKPRGENRGLKRDNVTELAVQDDQVSTIPGASSGFSSAGMPPDHPQLRTMRQNAIMRMQQTQGNAAVMRSLKKHSSQSLAPGKSRTPLRLPIVSVRIQRAPIHMQSGRFVGSMGGPENNIREEVLSVIDQLAVINDVDPALGQERTAIMALPANSSVPSGSMPQTLRGIALNEQPTLSVRAAGSLGITIAAPVGRGQTNNKVDVLVLQDLLHTYWHISNGDYSTERAAINSAAGPAVSEAAITHTLDGIPGMKADFVGGNFGVGRLHALAVSGEGVGMVGQTATWVPSGPGSSGRFGNTFERWASAATEAAAGPLPPLTSATRINCWEMVILMALRSGMTNWTWVHNLYTTSVGPGWGAALVNALSRGSRVTYHRNDPNSPIPNRGQIVFWNGSDHVGLANGGRDGAGRVPVISFWPPPGQPSRPGTADQVKNTTVEELADYMTPIWGAPPVEFGGPPW